MARPNNESPFICGEETQKIKGLRGGGGRWRKTKTKGLCCTNLVLASVEP